MRSGAGYRTPGPGPGFGDEAHSHGAGRAIAQAILKKGGIVSVEKPYLDIRMILSQTASDADGPTRLVGQYLSCRAARLKGYQITLSDIKLR